MKYLFKIIWLIIVILWSIIEGLFVLLCGVLCTLWEFKFPKNIWKETHIATCPHENHWGGYCYMDSNILYTIIRRYLFTFRDIGCDTAIIDAELRNVHDVEGFSSSYYGE